MEYSYHHVISRELPSSFIPMIRPLLPHGVKCPQFYSVVDRMNRTRLLYPAGLGCSALGPI